VLSFALLVRGEAVQQGGQGAWEQGVGAVD